MIRIVPINPKKKSQSFLNKYEFIKMYRILTDFMFYLEK